MRVLVGAAARVTSPPFLDLDQDPATPTSPAVTGVQVPTGDPVTLTGIVAASEGGTCTAVLHAMAGLGPVDLTWTGTVAGESQTLIDRVEVVGGRLATVVQVMANPEMKHKTIDGPRIRTLLDEFAALVEDYRGASPVLRWAREQLHPDDGILSHRCPAALVGVTVDGAPIDHDDPAIVELTTVGVRFPGGRPSGDIVVDYNHRAGPTVFDPGTLTRAAVTWVATIITREDAGGARDYIWAETDGGPVRYSTTNKDQKRPTGILPVDDALNTLPDLRVQGLG